MKQSIIDVPLGHMDFRKNLTFLSRQALQLSYLPLCNSKGEIHNWSCEQYSLVARKTRFSSSINGQGAPIIGCFTVCDFLLASRHLGKISQFARENVGVNFVSRVIAALALEINPIAYACALNSRRSEW